MQLLASSVHRTLAYVNRTTTFGLHLKVIACFLAQHLSLYYEEDGGKKIMKHLYME